MSINQIDESYEPTYTIFAIQTGEVEFYIDKLTEITNLRSVPFNTIAKGKRLLPKNIDRHEAVRGLAEILSAYYEQTVPMAKFVAEIIKHSPGQAEIVKEILNSSTTNNPASEKQSEMTTPIVIIDD